MNEVDTLVKEKIIPMRKRLVDSLLQKHPHILGLAEKYLAGNNNRIGMRVTENGGTVGEYTFHLDGLQIRDIEYGVLASELHVPLGIIRPYVIVDKSVLEQMLNDEQEFINNLFTTSWKYLPDTTVKFLR
ncbi:hypothetical protein REC12_12055 [Desulfosporosinus sp. PR]|uniref:hypothetical protein n=1 Tax=Candidatus Desulfosporosinus nitrosoreducens TaxID=3401928 RepID=UPI0027F87298|nr:hypothetical protein [Desulfosporosinus sp. PR]MDQ7094324.1 hypothetical protein [Desulfosporosinus sp. PR]